MGRDNGHRPGLRRQRQRANECRGCCCRDIVTGRVRLDRDADRSWTMPFAFSVCLLLFAIVMIYWIRPDRPIEAVLRVGRLAVAGE
jgi:hypothetical protein